MICEYDFGLKMLTAWGRPREKLNSFLTLYESPKLAGLIKDKNENATKTLMKSPVVVAECGMFWMYAFDIEITFIIQECRHLCSRHRQSSILIIKSLFEPFWQMPYFAFFRRDYEDAMHKTRRSCKASIDYGSKILMAFIWGTKLKL